MDAPWHRSWPEIAELHVFDPEGDVLLILERYQEDDLEEPGPPEAAPPLSADILDWPAHEPEPVRYESQAETAGTEVDGLTKPESSASTFVTRRESKSRVEKVQLRASSKHLILASPTFRTSLGSDTYPEGRTLQIEGTLAACQGGMVISGWLILPTPNLTRAGFQFDGSIPLVFTESDAFQNHLHPPK
ncbi:hypothetical protein DL98DRAFT_598253 [Cadophora sp. DSE1049]|nr:hypothetical protein DL98DRAFT_598253 [Cadophora sp. DSE1049]